MIDSKLRMVNLIRKNKVEFHRYYQGNFYYRIREPFTKVSYQFKIPMEDIMGTVLLREDRAIVFMKWIRKAINNNTFIAVSE